MFNIFVQICVFVSWHTQTCFDYLLLQWSRRDVFWLKIISLNQYLRPGIKMADIPMMAKPIKTLQLHYLMNQFLLKHSNIR